MMNTPSCLSVTGGVRKREKRGGRRRREGALHSFSLLPVAPHPLLSITLGKQMLLWSLK